MIVTSWINTGNCRFEIGTATVYCYRCEKCGLLIPTNVQVDGRGDPIRLQYPQKDIMDFLVQHDRTHTQQVKFVTLEGRIDPEATVEVSRAMPGETLETLSQRLLESDTDKPGL